MKNKLSRSFRALVLMAAVGSLTTGCYGDWKPGTRIDADVDGDSFAGAGAEAGPARDGAGLGDRPDSAGDAIPGSGDAAADVGDGPFAATEAGRDGSMDGPADVPATFSDAADAPADGAPVMDASPDACSCPESKNPCTESVCSMDGQCQSQAKPNKTTCEKGVCWEGECCQGCIAEGKCVEGGENQAAACGVGGAECTRCDDGNPCTDDVCQNGRCGTVNLSKVSCKDGEQAGVCVDGACTCGGAGQPCCSGTTDCRDGLKCLGGTCGECGSAGKPCCPGTPDCAGSAVCVGRVPGGAAGTCQKCGGLSEQCCGNETCTAGVCDKASNTCKACGEADQLCCKGATCKNDGLVCTPEGTCKACGGQGQPCCVRSSGSSCTSDGNLCNGEEKCEGGTCKRTPAVTCEVPGQCQLRVNCDPSTGACFPTPKANGTACNDNDACTRADTCQGGLCTGTNQVVCTTANQCERPGTCSPATGLCSPATNKDDGATCDDGDSCTGGDKCSAGNCSGTRTCVCVPGTRRCTGSNGLILQVCSPAGQWGGDVPCDYACSQTQGICTKKEHGDRCGDRMECLSGACVDGFCCNVACDRRCETCAAPGQEGLCVTVTSQADDKCEGTCDSRGECKSKAGQACTATGRPAAEGCISGTTCTSDGYCCNQSCGSGSCAGSCKDQSDGKCVYPPPMACGTAGCDGSRFVDRGMCKEGACVLPPSQACAGGAICANNACKTSCDSSADCVETHMCAPVGATSNACRLDATAVDGARHTCALLSDRSVRCWGYNQFGQLGDNTKIDRWTPAEVRGVSNVGTLAGVKTLSAGFSHTCALLENETVRCWGYNFYGQLGNNTTDESATPVEVRGVNNVGALAGVIALSSADSSHTCGVLRGGAVRCWGRNVNGQLGDGTTANGATPVEVRGVNNVGALTGATAVSAGASYTCALLSDETLRCWGSNVSGQLGDSTTNQSVTPVVVKGVNNLGLLMGVTAISAGNSHMCALLSDKTVRCWGYNSDGQLGDGTTTNRATPVEVRGANNIGILAGVTAISAGNSHTCALLSDKSIRCWGSNTAGQLGGGTTAAGSTTPIEVKGVNNMGTLTGVASVSAGSRHTCALLSDGAIRCWGFNDHGQLGDNSTSQRSAPVPVWGW